jgi:SAM-dependent methyltransferase
MHDSSYEKMEAFVRVHLDASRGRPLQILDFGSQTVDDQPRSYRDLFVDPEWSYLGLDIEAGANVDLVVGDAYHWAEVASDSIDVVVSGQALEHVEYFWASMFEITRVLRPGGLAVIIAPSNGVEHRYPVDCWRFYRDGFAALARYVGCEVVDVFTDWNRAVWADSVLVARKPAFDTAQRARFHRRAALQRALLSDDIDPVDLSVEPSSDEPAPSPIADVTPGALAAELQAIREAHLAEEAAAAAVEQTSPTQAATPSRLAVAYGRVRATIAGLAGERGRQQYKKLRGRA